MSKLIVLVPILAGLLLLSYNSPAYAEEEVPSNPETKTSEKKKSAEEPKKGYDEMVEAIAKAKVSSPEAAGFIEQADRYLRMATAVFNRADNLRNQGLEAEAAASDRIGVFLLSKSDSAGEKAVATLNQDEVDRKERGRLGTEELPVNHSWSSAMIIADSDPKKILVEQVTSAALTVGSGSAGVLPAISAAANPNPRDMESAYENLRSLQITSALSIIGAGGQGALPALASGVAAANSTPGIVVRATDPADAARKISQLPPGITHINLDAHGGVGGETSMGGKDFRIDQMAPAYKAVMDRDERLGTSSTVCTTQCYGSTIGQQAADLAGTPVSAGNTINFWNGYGYNTSKGGRVQTFFPRR